MYTLLRSNESYAYWLKKLECHAVANYTKCEKFSAVEAMSNLFRSYNMAFHIRNNIALGGSHLKILLQQPIIQVCSKMRKFIEACTQANNNI